MKLEKMLKTLVLSSVLLVSLAAAAGAAETASAPLPAAAADLPAAAEAVPATVTPAGNCDRAAAAPLYRSAVEKDSDALAATCGTCSAAGCSGAPRGQMCWTGGIHGQWGRCNVYSGNSCPAGGWECACGTGPIP